MFLKVPEGFQRKKFSSCPETLLLPTMYLIDHLNINVKCKCVNVAGLLCPIKHVCCSCITVSSLNNQQDASCKGCNCSWLLTPQRQSMGTLHTLHTLLSGHCSHQPLPSAWPAPSRDGGTPQPPADPPPRRSENIHSEVMSCLSIL